MPRFYSADWVAAFNEAVGDLAPSPAAGEPGTGTVGGRSRFRVAQLVAGSPEGELCVVLDVAGDRVRLERVDPPAAGRPSPSAAAAGHGDGQTAAGHGDGQTAAGHGDGQTAGGRADEPADVTVMLSYEDAAALSRGEVDAATLVTSGRLKVRGNLSLLVAGQALLVAAAERLAPLAAATTY